MKIVPSTLHQKIKFPTLGGIEEIIRDQASAWECYFNALKSKGKQELQHRVFMAELKSNVLKDLEEIPLCQGRPKRVVKIGTRMGPQIHLELIDFLKQHQTIFAQLIDDMVGISPEIITHKLEVDSYYPLVRQKRRKFALEQNKIINEEAKKLKQNSFIREVHYLNWLANVVVIV